MGNRYGVHLSPHFEITKHRYGERIIDKEYRENHNTSIRNSVHGTTVSLCMGYEEYGVRIVPNWQSIKIGTGYGKFFEYVIPGLLVKALFRFFSDKKTDFKNFSYIGDSIYYRIRSSICERERNLG